MRPLLLSLIAGCSFSTSVDLQTDAAVTPTDACATYSDQLETCALRMGPPLELSGTLEFSTLTGMLTEKATGKLVAVNAQELGTKGDPVYAILAEKVTFAPNTTLRALGPKGFAIIATSSIELGANALIDVSDNGAGARTSLCEGGPTKARTTPVVRPAVVVRASRRRAGRAATATPTTACSAG